MVNAGRANHQKTRGFFETPLFCGFVCQNPPPAIHGNSQQTKFTKKKLRFKAIEPSGCTTLGPLLLEADMVPSACAVKYQNCRFLDGAVEIDIRHGGHVSHEKTLLLSIILIV